LRRSHARRTRKLVPSNFSKKRFFTLDQILLNRQFPFRIFGIQALQFLNKLGSNFTIRICKLKKSTLNTRLLAVVKKKKLTEAIALFKGELDFSSMIDEIDSADDILE